MSDIETLTLAEYFGTGRLGVGEKIYVDTGVVEVRGYLVGVDVEYDHIYSAWSANTSTRRDVNKYILTFMGEATIEAYEDSTVVREKD